jgi:cyclohexadieny/prephenate dehydrogenase
MVRVGDGEGMQALFTRTRAIRRSIITAGQETAAPDFGRPHGTPEAVVQPTDIPAVTVREHGGGEDA